MKSILEVEIPKCFSTDCAFEEFILNDCRYLHEGTSRKVYEVTGRDYVVKVAINEKNVVCNWIEIASFLHFVEDRGELARICSWSISGKFLVMEKLDMKSDPSGEEPFDYPFWVTDRKSSNIGKSRDGTLKLCDYAFVKSPDEQCKSPFA